MNPDHLRILIVDDDEVIRFSLRESLESYGFLCYEAQNGLQALSSIKTYPVEVLLTDLNMPYMDGLELIRFIPQDFSLGSPLILLTSAGLNEDIRKMAYQAGAHLVLDKPFSISEILDAIQIHHDHFPQAA